MQELYGIGEPLAAHNVEDGRCPVTGLTVDDVSAADEKRVAQ